MKEKDQRDLIHYRLGRSREALEEAFLMQREKHWNTCVNRLYYACFYAVTALLAIKGMSSGKHSGVKSLFNHYWVKTHKIDKEYGKLICPQTTVVLINSILSSSYNFYSYH